LVQKKLTIGHTQTCTSATNGFLSIYYVEYIQKGECSSHAFRPFFTCWIRIHIKTNELLLITLQSHCSDLCTYKYKYIKIFCCIFYNLNWQNKRFTYLPAKTITKLHLLQEFLLLITEAIILLRRCSLRIKQQCTSKYSRHTWSKSSGTRKR
jgi:hypothetical protein